MRTRLTWDQIGMGIVACVWLVAFVAGLLYGLCRDWQFPRG